MDEKKKGNLISVSRKTPSGVHGRVFPELMPSSLLLWNYKQGTVCDKEYARIFNEQLAKLDAHKIAERLGDNAILLCYEGSDKFCHRHLIAAWLRNHGYDVSEYQD